MSESVADASDVGGSPTSEATSTSVPVAAPGGVPSVEELFRAEGTALVRLARIFTDDRNAAEDLVQEAFIQFQRSRHRIRHADAATAYLRSIVLNLARDHNRRGLMSRRHHASVLPDPGPDPFDDALVDRLTSNQQGHRVLDALRELPRRQRDCLVLRFHVELSEREIARTLGISPNTVKTHVRRGIATLQSVLGGPDVV